MPSQPAVFNNRAAVFIEMGEIERAIADYDKAISARPEPIGDTLQQPGRGLAPLKGNLDRALAGITTRRSELDPNSVDA